LGTLARLITQLDDGIVKPGCEITRNWLGGANDLSLLMSQNAASREFSLTAYPRFADKPAKRFVEPERPGMKHDRMSATEFCNKTKTSLLFPKFLG